MRKKYLVRYRPDGTGCTQHGEVIQIRHGIVYMPFNRTCSLNDIEAVLPVPRLVDMHDIRAARAQ